LIIVLSPESPRARTILPGIDMVPASFDVYGTGPGGAVLDLAGLTPGESSPVQLIEGEWTVSATAKNAAGTAIGQGSAQATVNAGQSVRVGIRVGPLAGTGSFSLNATIPAGLLSDPRIAGILTDSSGTEKPFSMGISADKATAQYLDPALAAGYYSLSLSLLDGTFPRGAFADSLRIVSGQNTSASIAIQYDPGTGGFIADLSAELQDPIGISLSGLEAVLRRNQSMTVSANAGPGIESYAWYLDGQALAGRTSAAVTIAGSLPPLGAHRLDVLVKKGGIFGSAHAFFSVAEAAPQALPIAGTWNAWGTVFELSDTALVEAVAAPTIEATIVSADPALNRLICVWVSHPSPAFVGKYMKLVYRSVTASGFIMDAYESADTPEEAASRTAIVYGGNVFSRPGATYPVDLRVNFSYTGGGNPDASHRIIINLDRTDHGEILATRYLSASAGQVVFSGIESSSPILFLDLAFDADGDGWHSAGDPFSFHKNAAGPIGIDVSGGGSLTLDANLDDSVLFDEGGTPPAATEIGPEVQCLEIAVGDAVPLFGPAAQTPVQAGHTLVQRIDLRNMPASLSVTVPVSADGEYLSFSMSGREAEIDAVQYLDSSGVVLGGFLTAGPPVRQGASFSSNQPSELSADPSILDAADGRTVLYGFDDGINACSHGALLGAASQVASLRLVLRHPIVRIAGSLSGMPIDGSFQFLLRTDDAGGNLNQCGGDIAVQGGSGVFTYHDGYRGRTAGSEYVYTLYCDADRDYDLDPGEWRSTASDAWEDGQVRIIGLDFGAWSR
jgi:hypothetical protein